MGAKKDRKKIWLLRIAGEIIGQRPSYPYWDDIRPGEQDELMDRFITRVRDLQEEELASVLELDDKELARSILMQKLGTLRNPKPRNSTLTQKRFICYGTDVNEIRMTDNVTICNRYELESCQGLDAVHRVIRDGAGGEGMQGTKECGLYKIY